MSLLTEKYRPRTLDDFDFNSDFAMRLKNIADVKNLPHCVFFGPESSGKRCRVMAMLREVYGDGVYQKEVKQIKAPSKKTVIITYLQSNHHLEIDFKPYGTNDRVVISDFIKERCKSRNMITKNVRAIVIHNAHTISFLGQKMLLNMIEKSKSTARFIFIVNTLSQLIQPMKSRCFLIKCRGPKKEEIVKILLNIAKKEKIKLSKKRANEIVDRSSLTWHPNLRNSIHIMQMSYLETRYKGYKLKPMEYLDNLIKAILKKDIMKIREFIFILTAKNVDATQIITYLLDHFINRDNITADQKIDLVSTAASYQEKMIKGNKLPFYIEAFIAAAVNIVEGST